MSLNPIPLTGLVSSLYPLVTTSLFSLSWTWTSAQRFHWFFTPHIWKDLPVPSLGPADLALSRTNDLVFNFHSNELVSVDLERMLYDIISKWKWWGLILGYLPCLPPRLQHTQSCCKDKLFTKELLTNQVELAVGDVGPWEICRSSAGEGTFQSPLWAACLPSPSGLLSGWLSLPLLTSSFSTFRLWAIFSIQIS